MSQNGLTSVHSRGGQGACGGTIGLGHSAMNTPGSNMNVSSSPTSVSWNHVNNGALVSGASGNQNAPASTVQLQQQDGKEVVSSPQNSNQSGSTLKEHDLLGLSDVSSNSRESPVQGSLQDEGNEFEELNLKMELGPPAARKKADTAFSHPRTPAASEQQQQVPASSECGNSHGGSDGSQGVEQGTVVVDKSSSSPEQKTAAQEQKQQQQGDRGLSYGAAPSQGGRPDTGGGCRPLIDSEALMKWHAEQQAGDRKSANEGLRLGISLNSHRGTSQDCLNEKKTFLSSTDVNREAPQEQQQEDPSWQQERTFQEDASTVEKTQEQRPIVVQDQQHQQVTKQQQQLERQKQFEAYQMAEKRPGMERKCLPVLQQPCPELRFQNVPERSPRLPEHSSNRLWANQMKFRPDCMVVSSTAAYPQQHSSAQQQDIECSRAGYPPVCAGNFAVNRNLYAAPKFGGVTGSKRNFDAMGADARSLNESRTGPSGPLPASGGAINTVNGSVDAEAIALPQQQQQLKVQPGMQMYPWGSQKSVLAAPTWHLGLEQSGGSFGPFPSSQRPTPGASGSKCAAAEVGAPGSVVVDAKTWDGQPKAHQEIVSASTPKVPPAADSKQSASDATTSDSAPRAAPAAVGWPPIRSFRKNLAGTTRPVPFETATPRQPPPPPPSPAPVATSSVAAGQSNSWFVKVNMDGYPVGRKVDLRSNSSYDKLSQALDEMFRPQFETFLKGQIGQNRISLPSDLKRNFLQGPDFVLTYEDQEGDLMLVGDVPWTMFIDTVKRLRIMKGSEAIGLGNRAAEKSIKTIQLNV